MGAPLATRLLPASALAIALAGGLGAAPARAQFQPTPMRLPATSHSETVAGPFSGLGGDDLLVMEPPGPVFQRFAWHRDLLTPRTFPTPTPTDGGYIVGGRFEPAAAGARQDLVYGTLDGLAVSFGSEPGTSRTFAGLFPSPPFAVGRARLLPRPEPVVVATIDTGNVPSQLRAVDLAAARTQGTAPQVSFAVPSVDSANDGDVVDRVYPLQLSPAAQAGGLEDVALPVYQGVVVLWHRSVPESAALSSLDVQVVESGARDAVSIQAWLPPGQSTGGSALGVAALDADGDGVADLVFSYAHDGVPSLPGALLYARSSGDPAGLATPPWRELSGRADLSELVDPLTLRQLPLAAPTMAIFDRRLGEILLVRGDARSGFTVRHLPAPGVTVRDMFLADVVGSPAPDLVALVVRSASDAEIWVYPDEGDAAPSVAFAPPPPAEALRGQDLPLSVAAADADSPFTVSWMLGGRLTPPLAAGSAWVVPGASLCAAGGATLEVTVRAQDDQGVFTEVAASLPVVARPALRLVGAAPDRLTLPPGGASAEAEGSAWPACGRSATFTWGETGLDGLVETGLTSDATSTRRRFAVPEAAYPTALDGQPTLTLAAVDDLGASGAAALPLVLDAEGLVEVTVSSDPPVLEQGAVARLVVRLGSRLGVALPGVRASVRVAGLALAGPLEVVGAVASPGSGPSEVVLASLPPAPAQVTLQVPVRGLGQPGGAAAEAFSRGGHRLSPPAAPGGSGARLPGCGCGGGGGDRSLWPLGLVLVLRALRARRRRLT